MEEQDEVQLLSRLMQMMEMMDGPGPSEPSTPAPSVANSSRSYPHVPEMQSEQPNNLMMIPQGPQQNQSLQPSQTQPQRSMPIQHHQPIGHIEEQLGLLTQVAKTTLHQLLQVLKSPDTTERKQQVLQILKANPQLMTAFIRHRQRQQQNVQEGQSQACQPMTSPVTFVQPQQQHPGGTGLQNFAAVGYQHDIPHPQQMQKHPQMMNPQQQQQLDWMRQQHQQMFM